MRFEHDVHLFGVFLYTTCAFSGLEPPSQKTPRKKSLQIFCGDPGRAHRTGTECRTEGPAIVTRKARQSRRARRAVRRQCAISSLSGRIASGIICGTAEVPQRRCSCPSAEGVPRNGGFPFKGERSGSPPKVFSVGLMRGKPAGRGNNIFYYCRKKREVYPA